MSQQKTSCLRRNADRERLCTTCLACALSISAETSTGAPATPFTAETPLATSAPLTAATPLTPASPLTPATSAPSAYSQQLDKFMSLYLWGCSEIEQSQLSAAAWDFGHGHANLFWAMGKITGNAFRAPAVPRL